jgi:predicted GIY-YIG superfamily endonuclease
LNLEFSEYLGDRARAQQFEYRVKRLERDRKEALIAGHCSLAELLPD